MATSINLAPNGPGNQGMMNAQESNLEPAKKQTSNAEQPGGIKDPETTSSSGNTSSPSSCANPNCIKNAIRQVISSLQNLLAKLSGGEGGQQASKGAQGCSPKGHGNADASKSPGTPSATSAPNTSGNQITRDESPAAPAKEPSTKNAQVAASPGNSSEKDQEGYLPAEIPADLKGAVTQEQWDKHRKNLNDFGPGTQGTTSISETTSLKTTASGKTELVDYSGAIKLEEARKKNDRVAPYLPMVSEIANKVNYAMHGGTGAGTWEKQVYDELTRCGRDKELLQAVEEMYGQKYQRKLRDDLAGEMGGTPLQYALHLLDGGEKNSKLHKDDLPDNITWEGNIPGRNS